MIEGMNVRNLWPAPQRSYLHAVARFSVEQGKGDKDRYIMLPAQQPGILRSYRRLVRPKV